MAYTEGFKRCLSLLQQRIAILMKIRPLDLISIGYGELIRRYNLKIIHITA